MKKYYKRLKGERPLSTLSKEEYEMLRDMGLLWELYPDAAPEYVDLSMVEFLKSKRKD